MFASDRLSELRRQRALVQEHLVWLDREIAAAEAALPSPSSAPTQTAGTREARPDPATVATVPASPTADDLARADDDADAILRQYTRQPGDVQRDLRRGCLLWVGLAVLLMAVAIAAVYYAYGD